MIKQALYAAAIAFLISAASEAQAQQNAAANADEVLSNARQHLQRGEQCLAAGDSQCARREFDGAVDEVLGSGIDLRGNEKLRAGWREMIEKINRYETAPAAANGKQVWISQEFEGQPPRDNVAGDASIEPGPAGDVGTFQRRFAELRKRFRGKYERDMTLTGADHAEHRRLYGSGSAYDIRVRDLTREQVGYIIATGGELGLRIKDFSTWESVAAHNARTLMLGRALDTLATGVHLHIDRMAPSSKKSLSAVPVISKRQKQRR